MIPALITFGVIAFIIIIWYISAMNRLRQTEVKIDEALSGIDVALTKRFDTLTKMFDVAKSYAKFEKETILGAVKLRQGMSMSERNTAAANMAEAEKQIKILAENYPQLHANENFKQLQVSIMDCEEHLQGARRAYNANVSSLNQQIITFPTSIVAGNIGIVKRDFFAAEEAKKSDVDMKFDI